MLDAGWFRVHQFILLFTTILNTIQFRLTNEAKIDESELSMPDRLLEQTFFYLAWIRAFSILPSSENFHSPRKVYHRKYIFVKNYKEKKLTGPKTATITLNLIWIWSESHFSPFYFNFSYNRRYVSEFVPKIYCLLGFCS